MRPRSPALFVLLTSLLLVSAPSYGKGRTGKAGALGKSKGTVAELKNHQATQRGSSSFASQNAYYKSQQKRLEKKKALALEKASQEVSR